MKRRFLHLESRNQFLRVAGTPLPPMGRSSSEFRQRCSQMNRPISHRRCGEGEKFRTFSPNSDEIMLDLQS